VEEALSLRVDPLLDPFQDHTIPLSLEEHLAQDTRVVLDRGAVEPVLQPVQLVLSPIEPVFPRIVPPP